MNYLQRNCIQLREQSAGDEDLRGEAGALVKPVCWGSEIQSIKGTLYKNEHAHPIPTPFAQIIHLSCQTSPQSRNMVSTAASYYKATLAVTTGLSAPFNNLAVIYKQQVMALDTYFSFLLFIYLFIFVY